MKEKMQKLNAYDPKKEVYVPLFLYWDQCYEITLEGGKNIYGWFDTTEEHLSSIHKLSGFESLDQLVILDYEFDVSDISHPCINEVQKVMDVQREIKHIRPIELIMSKDLHQTFRREMAVKVTIADRKDILIHKELPILITTIKDKVYRGLIKEIGSNGFFKRKKYIEIVEVRSAAHPVSGTVRIPVDEIKDAYPIRFHIRI